MRLSALVGKRTKETPKEAQSKSHVFLLRGGYVRPVTTGVYSLLPLGKRIARKIEQIIREEMDAIDGQEILMPIVMPRELWEESGRYQSIGPEMVRFKDRNERDLLLGMTHEEAVVQIARSELSSYKQLPAMLYQIQTKFRDEARPRAGLIRVREFTMKDAYSFHASQEDLERYYARCHAAYERIFARLGMKHVVSIESDTGMMGGATSHEFMALADVGEDTIFMSPDGRYKANKEIARTALAFTKEAPKPLERLHTPGQKTIQEVATFLGVKPAETGKAVFYTDGEALFFVVIRGDLEVNEVKLRNHLKTKELKMASDPQIRRAGAVPGYASPVGIDGNAVRVLFDRSAAESSNLVVGANAADYHYKNFNFERDLGEARARVEVLDLAMARAGDPCPVTGEPLVMTRGIEVGNIFQLGTKYSTAMSATFLDQSGKARPFVMGCYGIGVGRALASVIEQSHDDYGPIWPESIAPFQVHIAALSYDEAQVQEASERLYRELTRAGVEVLLDDRNEKAGSAFSDADLIGVPHRLIVSPKTLADGGRVEYKRRGGDKSAIEKLTLEQAIARFVAP